MKRHALALGAATIALAACTVEEPEIATGPIAMVSADDCASFDTSILDANSASTKWVGAAEGIPAYCEVAGIISPAAGSNINVVYRLPEGWNGKLLGLGGGGWAGNITTQAAQDGLAKGYATLQTDGGNAGTDVWANSWVAQRPASATDFSYRAIHEMTERGKRLAAAFYGQPHSRAYFQGCSTGGRMALMEAQRFPEDYDAIIAGAPVYTLQVQTSAVFRNQAFGANDGAGGFSMADLQLVQDAALKACDGSDGVEDGIINDPRACTFQPSTLQCTGAKNASCLSAPQITALQQVYDGRRASDGSWAMHPMRRGGEAGWSFFVGTDGSGNDTSGGGGLANLFPLFFGDRDVTLASFNDADYRRVRGSEFAAMYEASNADLSSFFDHGGKLLMYHGESDPGPSPENTNDYVRAVLAENPEARDDMRYFLLPGVGHCAGGPGADAVDYLDALDKWVETGRAPERLIGGKRDGSLTRPHCAWPDVARLEGDGDPNDPDAWSCVARS